MPRGAPPGADVAATEYSRAADHFDLVFSNKTESDALCVELRGELQKSGLWVWQQRENISRDASSWFDLWYQSAEKARKIVCFLTVAYLKSEFCMREWQVAQAKGKLVVVLVDPYEQLMAVDTAGFPKASSAKAYIETGGQVIFTTNDVAGELLKLIPPHSERGGATLGVPPQGTGPHLGHQGGDMSRQSSQVSRMGGGGGGGSAAISTEPQPEAHTVSSQLPGARVDALNDPEF